MMKKNLQYVPSCLKKKINFVGSATFWVFSLANIFCLCSCVLFHNIKDTSSLSSDQVSKTSQRKFHLIP